MIRILCFLFLLISGSAAQCAETAEDNAIFIAPFLPDAPRELIEAWLRVHDEELCLKIDAVFVTDEDSLQVWGVAEDEKSYKKLLKILEPLSDFKRVEIFAAESVPHDKSDGDGAPPSLWENDELRTFYRAPRPQSKSEIKFEWPLSMVTQEEVFAQRMIIFARQTLENSENLRRYAEDLPALTHIALEPAYDSDLRLLAWKICREHTREMEKQIDKLKKNLSQALPKGKGKKEFLPEDMPGSGGEVSTRDLAVQISGRANDVARQVHSFIYPDSHTIGVDELRNPGLLEALRALRELDEIYIGKMSREVVDF